MMIGETCRRKHHQVSQLARNMGELEHLSLVRAASLAHCNLQNSDLKLNMKPRGILKTKILDFKFSFWSLLPVGQKKCFEKASSFMVLAQRLGKSVTINNLRNSIMVTSHHDHHQRFSDHIQAKWNQPSSKQKNRQQKLAAAFPHLRRALFADAKSNVVRLFLGAQYVDVVGNKEFSCSNSCGTPRWNELCRAKVWLPLRILKL